MSTMPDFDEELAKSYIGKYILIGITYEDYNGREIERQQLHGTVKIASKEKGILIELKGINEGKTWNMPPDIRSISEADPGIYSLYTTGEEIENPDLLCTWVVQRPDS